MRLPEDTKTADGGWRTCSPQLSTIYFTQASQTMDCFDELNVCNDVAGAHIPETLYLDVLIVSV